MFFFLLSLLFGCCADQGRSDRLKNANPVKQEQGRLEFENAEDDLVQKTEVAITHEDGFGECLSVFLCMFCCC